MRRKRNFAGFSLVEVVIAVAVIGILAGVSVPAAQAVLTRARTSRAQTEINTIVEAIQQFRKDTKRYPVNSGGVPNGGTANENIVMLYSFGTTPNSANNIWQIPVSSIANSWDEHLIRRGNTGCETPDPHTCHYNGWNPSSLVGWNGPYLQVNQDDPWKNRYQAWVGGFRNNPSTIVWVISAGANGILETQNNVEAIPNNIDDVGKRIQ